MTIQREELCIGVRKEKYEGKIICKKNMQRLQDREKKETPIRYLYKSQAQTATGIVFCL